MDGLCLQAWGHPTDYKVRQELLSALEWDHSDHPEHAHPVIRDLFKQVHDRSVDLSKRLRSATGQPDAAIHTITHGAQDLRQALGALIQALKNRHGTPSPDQAPAR